MKKLFKAAGKILVVISMGLLLNGVLPISTMGQEYDWTPTEQEKLDDMEREMDKINEDFAQGRIDLDRYTWRYNHLYKRILKQRALVGGSQTTGTTGIEPTPQVTTGGTPSDTTGKPLPLTILDFSSTEAFLDYVSTETTPLPLTILDFPSTEAFLDYVSTATTPLPLTILDFSSTEAFLDYVSTETTPLPLTILDFPSTEAFLDYVSTATTPLPLTILDFSSTEAFLDYVSTATTPLPLTILDFSSTEAFLDYVSTATTPLPLTILDFSSTEAFLDYVSMGTPPQVTTGNQPEIKKLTEPIIEDMPPGESLGGKIGRGLLGGLAGMAGMPGGSGEDESELADKPKGPWVRLEGGPKGKTKIDLTAYPNDDGTGLNVGMNIKKAPGKGAPHLILLQHEDGMIIRPVQVLIFELWGEWTLTVSVWRETHRDGQLVNREHMSTTTSSWKELLGTYRAVIEGPAIWQQLGSGPFKKIRGVIAEFKIPTEFDPSKWTIIAHVTGKGKDTATGKKVIKTVPFVADLSGNIQEKKLEVIKALKTRFQRSHGS